MYQTRLPDTYCASVRFRRLLRSGHSRGPGGRSGVRGRVRRRQPRRRGRHAAPHLWHPQSPRLGCWPYLPRWQGRDWPRGHDPGPPGPGAEPIVPGASGRGQDDRDSGDCTSAGGRDAQESGEHLESPIFCVYLALFSA